MKKQLVSIGLVGFLAACDGGAMASKSAVEVSTDEQKLGYSYGSMLGARLKDQLPGIDLTAFAAGLSDAYAGKPLQVEQAVSAELVQKAEMAKQEAFIKDQQGVAQTNLAKGEAFLSTKAEEEGIVTLPSGLLYKELKAGEGDLPSAEDTVVVHYRGTLVDGSEFDSSYNRGQPASFRVGGVIKGWTEALQLMPKGAKWQLFIPTGLAYGENAPPSIGPNQALVFEVELIDINAG